MPEQRDFDRLPDHSEEDLDIKESGGKFYIRDGRYKTTYTSIDLPREKRFREGSIEEDVQRIWGKH